jgi:hypothetical protein
MGQTNDKSPGTPRETKTAARDIHRKPLFSFWYQGRESNPYSITTGGF